MKNQRVIETNGSIEVSDIASWLDSLIGNVVPGTDEIVVSIHQFQAIPVNGYYVVIAVVNTEGVG